MKRVTIVLSDTDHDALLKLLTVCQSSTSSHGPLTSIEKLLTLLLEDCVLAVQRPGSWEGAGILDVLARHGYYG